MQNKVPLLQMLGTLDLTLISIVVAILTLASYLLARKYIPRFLHHLIGLHHPKWEKIFQQNNSLTPAMNLVPALFIYFSLSYFPLAYEYVDNIVLAVIILLITIFINKLTITFGDIYNIYPLAKRRPIKGFVQFVIIFTSFVGGGSALFVFLGMSPTLFLGGITASSAIVLFIFSDTIKSFIAGMQILINRMLRPGDWIEAPEFDANGYVTDVALHTIKVQNWDKSIVNIPALELMKSGFKNWRGMYDAGGKRIQRSLLLDQTSIHDLSVKELDTILQKPQIQKNKEVAKALKAEAKNLETNLGAFRTFVRLWLRHHPEINQELALVVSLKEPTPAGIPLEIYVFTKDTDAEVFERIQSEVFEKLISLTPLFGLRLFQNPSGYDFGKALAKVR